MFSNGDDNLTIKRNGDMLADISVKNLKNEENRRMRHFFQLFQSQKNVWQCTKQYKALFTRTRFGYAFSLQDDDGIINETASF